MRTHRWADRPEPDPNTPVVNPFATRTIAVRYASARPNLHHHVTPILLGSRSLVGPWISDAAPGYRRLRFEGSRA